MLENIANFNNWSLKISISTIIHMKIWVIVAKKLQKRMQIVNKMQILSEDHGEGKIAVKYHKNMCI